MGSLPAAEPGAFNRALNDLKHRGPDGQGTWVDDDRLISLGHTRLSVIDLSDDAAQPMHYGRYTIVYNGEIYNYQELKTELARLGHPFKTSSDTEVLVAAYAEWGVDCLSRLIGMWAFAIWDKENKSLFFSRDRFGEKPFFYSHNPDQFLFASEMKGLVPLMDQVEVSSKFGWMTRHMLDYEATELCLLEGVKRLLPGHYGIFSRGELTIERYYNLLDGLIALPTSYEDKVEQFRTLFFNSVNLRLRSDVPLGVALSGGLDSSSILGGMMQHKLPEKPTAFTAHYPGSAIDELQYAQQLTGSYNLPHQVVELNGVEALNSLPDDLYYFEELYRNAPSPMMALYQQYRQQGVFVSLDGHGPDELFSGYDNFIFLALLDAGMDTAAWDEILDTYGHMFPEGHGQFEQRKTNYLNVLKTKAWQVWEEMTGNRSAEEKQVLEKYSRELEIMGYLNAGLFRLFNYTTFPTLLRNYDRYAMRSGVEVRMPFTDHHLVEFCFSLTWKDKLKGGYTKKIMRDALAPYLPQEIVWRKQKVGFQSPLADWFAGPWKEWLEDTLADQTFSQHKHTNTRKARNLYKQFSQGKNDLETANALWQELMPYLWHKHFFERVTRSIE